MHDLSPSQRARLLNNSNVRSISAKYISFTAAFKLKAVKLFRSGSRPDDIFKDAGIPIELFRPDYCRLCIKKWLKKIDNEGAGSLKVDLRGKNAGASSGRPKNENLEALTYEELLSLVEIQKGVIEELKKKKALAKKKS